MNPDQENEDQDLKDEQRGLLVILGSLVIISTVVVVSVFIFFPFHSPSGPALVIEKTSPPTSLNENEFISHLNLESSPVPTEQKNPPLLGEEFFLEILPPQEVPLGITPPISEESSAPQPPIVKQNPTIPPSPPVKTPVKISQWGEKPSSPSNKKPNNSAEKSVSTPSGPSFWIQIGSYSDGKLADSVIEKLRLEGFEAQKILFNDGTRQLNRVRLGPYPSKEEANKFLGWIREMDSFKESYVLQTNL